VKNLFELKNARRVLIEGNLFERNWVAAQAGFAILFTVRNQSGSAPWSAVQDVTFRNNVVRSSSQGLNMHGRDNAYPSQQTARVLIRNNLFVDIGGRWGGDGRLFQVTSNTTDVVIEHNTGRQSNHVLMADGAPNHNFVFRYNIAPHNAYGFFGSGAGAGTQALAKYFPGAVFEGNVLAGAPTMSKFYPSDTYFPVTLEAVGFMNLVMGDYRLSSASPYARAAADGADIGVNVPDLDLAMGLSGVSRW
jgi:hypothetical protein